MSESRIICFAHVQRWNERNDAENLFVKEFDATERILEMGREAALGLRDNSTESDDIATPEIFELIKSIPEGTFYVSCEDSIREYFGVAEREDEN